MTTINQKLHAAEPKQSKKKNLNDLFIKLKLKFRPNLIEVKQFDDLWQVFILKKKS